MTPSGKPPHQQLVAAHLPALEAIEEAHAEQAGVQLAGLRNQGRNRALDDAADREAVERHRGGARAAKHPGGRGIDHQLEFARPPITLPGPGIVGELGTEK
jgi:hypothetical protein